MRVQTEEWRRFIPGVRMYKGKLTYFYNGEKIWDDENEDYLVNEYEERQTWEVIIVLPGVEIIPESSFCECKNVKKVIMADTVKRIEEKAFYMCESLKFVKLSRNLEYIGKSAFCWCESLTSIFIPPSCREIDDDAFGWCEELIILHVQRHTQLGRRVIDDTALLFKAFEASPFADEYGSYNEERVNEWIKNLNQNQELALHCECASFEPSEDNIYEIIKHQGLPSIHVKNQIGVTAFEYLQKNPYIDTAIDEHKLIKKLVLDLMGEIIIT